MLSTDRKDIQKQMVGFLKRAVEKFIASGEDRFEYQIV
jgi:hypothetical protein